MDKFTVLKDGTLHHKCDKTIGAHIHNKFEFEVRDAKTGDLKQSVTAHNIILDTLWGRLCNNQTFSGFIHFGTGTGTPTPERTTLFNWLGQRNMGNDAIIEYEAPVMSATSIIRLEPQEFVGETITEVGIGWGTAQTNLATHALLRDSEGNPISLLKTELDVVTISATVFASINLPNNARLLHRLPQGGFSQDLNLSIHANSNSTALRNALFGLLSGRRALFFGSSWAGETNGSSFINASTSAIGSGGSPIVGHTGTSDVRLGVISAHSIRGNVAERRLDYLSSINPDVKELRFGTTQANGLISEITVRNIMSITLPNSQRPPMEYNDVSVTDSIPVLGEGKAYFLPSSNVIEETASITVNGTPATFSEYKVVRDVRLTLVFSANILSPSGNLFTETGNNQRRFGMRTPEYDQHILVSRPAIDMTNAVLASDTIALRPTHTIVFSSDLQTEEITSFPHVNLPWLNRHNKLYHGINNGNLAIRTPSDEYQSQSNRAILNAAGNPANIGGLATRLSPDENTLFVANHRMFMRDEGGAYREIASLQGLPSGNFTGGDFTADGEWFLWHSVNGMAIYHLEDEVWVNRTDLLRDRHGGNATLGANTNTFVSTIDNEFVTSLNSALHHIKYINGRWLRRTVGNAHANVSGATDDLKIISRTHSMITDASWDTIVLLDEPAPTNADIRASYKVSGIHKTENFVVDFNFGIQFSG